MAAPRGQATTQGKAGLTGKSERTRGRILDAAAHVLSRKGYAGTRLTDVAALAAVQTAAIYYYFASRDELIEEVMWAGAHRVRTEVERALTALPPDTPPLDRIDEAVRAHLVCELEISDYATASIRNAGQVPEHLRVRPAAEEHLYSALWRDLFHAARESGALREGLDVSVSRLLLLGAMNWATEWWDPQRRSLDELVHATQLLVRHGMGAADASPESPGRPRGNTATP